MNEKLFYLIKSQLERGISKEDIKKAFLEEGYSEIEIDTAFAEIEREKFFRPDYNHNPQEPVQSFPQEQPSFNKFSQGFYSASPSQATSIQSSSLPSFSQKTSFFKKRSIKIVLIVFSALIGFYLITSAFFYFSFFNILKSSFGKFSQVKSMEYSGDSEIETSYKSSQSQKFNQFLAQLYKQENQKEKVQKTKATLKFNGAFDNKEKENPKSKFYLKLEFKDESSSNNNFLIEGEIRLLKKILYINLIDFSAPEPILFYVSYFKNKWIKIDTEKLAKSYGYDSFLKQYEKQNEEAKRKREEIEKIFLKTKPIKISPFVYFKIFKGKLVLVYNYKVDKRGLKEFIKESNKSLYNTTINDKELDSLDNLQIAEGTILIGAVDRFIYGFNINVKVKDKSNSQNYGEGKLDIIFDNYNKQIKIEVPENAIDYEDLIKEMEKQYNYYR